MNKSKNIQLNSKTPKILAESNIRRDNIINPFLEEIDEIMKTYINFYKKI